MRHKDKKKLFCFFGLLGHKMKFPIASYVTGGIKSRKPIDEFQLCNLPCASIVDSDVLS
jgi:hypothetical protein